MPPAPPLPAPLPPVALLPCPLAAGWEVVGRGRLPRRHGDGGRAGGHSAAAYLPERDQLWLLSDSPRGLLAGWQGLRHWPGRPLIPLGTVPLRGSGSAPLPAAIDGEGLVIAGEQAWVASEGRRSAERPAQLLAFDRRSGLLEQALPLPEAWRPATGRGLAANRGPESLAVLADGRSGPLLLMAAESPLLQDPPGRVRVLAWSLPDPDPPQPLRPLALPVTGDWGLTDLLVVSDAAGGPPRGGPPRGGPPVLLGLWRSFEAPDRWQARLVLYPLPTPARAAEPPLPPRFSWNLLHLGLPADNWEALTPGPPLADGRPTLLLLSDDNFSPLQENHLVRLAPRRGPGCGSGG